MSKVVLAGIDPSYSRTGISIYTGDAIVITNLSQSNKGMKKTFSNVWNSANDLSSRIVKLLLSYNVNGVISEVPPPQGCYSPGLWCLDSLIFAKLRNRVDTLYGLSPTYIGHVHGTRKYKKSWSVDVANEIINTLSMKVDIKTGRLNHDESESFIFLCRLLVRLNVCKDDLSFCRGLYSDKERLIF